MMMTTGLPLSSAWSESQPIEDGEADAASKPEKMTASNASELMYLFALSSPALCRDTASCGCIRNNEHTRHAYLPSTAS